MSQDMSKVSSPSPDPQGVTSPSSDLSPPASPSSGPRGVTSPSSESNNPLPQLSLPSIDNDYISSAPPRKLGPEKLKSMSPLAILYALKNNKVSGWVWDDSLSDKIIPEAEPARVWHGRNKGLKIDQVGCGDKGQKYLDEYAAEEKIKCCWCLDDINKSYLERHLKFCMREAKICPRCGIKTKCLGQHACSKTCEYCGRRIRGQNTYIHNYVCRANPDNFGICDMCGAEMRVDNIARHKKLAHKID